MASEPDRVRHRLSLAVVAAALVGVGGVVGIAANSGGTKTKTVTVGTSGPSAAATPVDPHVAAGAHDFVQFACAQCHGDRGRGGVSPDVPALTTVAKGMTPAVLRSIIDHGLGESSNPTKPYMPVWGAVISKTQVADLIAYLRAGLPAVPAAEPPKVRKEFNTEAKIIAVIRSGSVIGRAPIVSMPHWGGIIPDDQLKALVAYIETLK